LGVQAAGAAAAVVGGGAGAAWAGGGAAALVGADAATGGGGGGVVRFGVDPVRAVWGGWAFGGLGGAWVFTGWVAGAPDALAGGVAGVRVRAAAAAGVGVLPETGEVFAAGTEHPVSAATPVMGSTIKAAMTTMSARLLDVGTQK
jgi:hypothetical protein